MNTQRTDLTLSADREVQRETPQTTDITAVIGSGGYSLLARIARANGSLAPEPFVPEWRRRMNERFAAKGRVAEKECDAA